jgi:uncharacterized protein (DUF305 family)
VRYRLPFLLALLLSISLVAPAAAVPSRDGPASSPNVAQLETDFLMGMIPHHRQATMMAEMAVTKSPRSELRAFAQDIIDDQQKEIDEMSRYLREWYGMEPPAGSEMPMDTMMRNMPMMHGTMPDMMARMRALEEKSGGDFDIEFMSAMTDHHAMAIMMAAPVLINGDHPDLYKLAERIVISQGEEIQQMDEWLDEWYGVGRPV